MSVFFCPSFFCPSFFCPSFFVRLFLSVFFVRLFLSVFFVRLFLWAAKGGFALCGWAPGPFLSVFFCPSFFCPSCLSVFFVSVFFVRRLFSVFIFVRLFFQCRVQRVQNLTSLLPWRDLWHGTTFVDWFLSQCHDVCATRPPISLPIMEWIASDWFMPYLCCKIPSH